MSFGDQEGRWRPSGDLLSGVTFIGIGAAFLAVGHDLRFGSTSQPGPGFLPSLLSVILIGLGGALVVAHVLARGKRQDVSLPKPRPFLAVLGIFAFTALIQPAGFVIAASAVVALGLAAFGRFRAVELAALVVGLVGINILIFVVGLGQRIPLLP